MLALTAATIADAIARTAPARPRCWSAAAARTTARCCARSRRDLGAARVATTAAHGVPVEHVEALAFAWLARESLAGRPGNLPAVTGARGPRVLGAVYPALGRSANAE